MSLLASSYSYVFFFLTIPPPPRSTLFPYTTLFRFSVGWLGFAGGSPEPVGDPRELPRNFAARPPRDYAERLLRSEEHTSELQSHVNLVCRLLLEKKKKNKTLKDSLQQNRANT